MTKIFKTAFCQLIFAFPLLAIPSIASANLLITPLQIVFEERSRSTEVTLVNSGKEAHTYNLGWEQLDQVNGAGGYVPTDDVVRKERLDLEDFAVFTPRQITLAPNEKQIVRLAVRRPGDLPDGEYKSHLKFSIVPDSSLQTEAERNISEDEVGFGAKVQASYSIPVVYRTGDSDVKVELGQPELKQNPKTSNMMINLNVKRSGLHGVIGLIKVYYTPVNGKEAEIGALGNASLYSEIDNRDFTIPTLEKSINPGQLRIIFARAEGNANEYVVLEERTFPVGL